MRSQSLALESQGWRPRTNKSSSLRRRPFQTLRVCRRRRVADQEAIRIPTLIV